MPASTGDPGGPEEVLSGGNVADVVIRVGSTVRKPATRATPAVTALLDHLRTAGYPAAPRALGLDEQGRQVLEYVPGRVAHDLPDLTSTELRRLGRLVRELHDATADFVPPPDAVWDVVIPPPEPAEVIGHHDLAPWNLIRDGERWVFIDWDGAGPTTRTWDLVYAAHAFVPLWADRDADQCGARLRQLVDGYGLDAQQRAALPRLVAARTRAMSDLLHDAARTGRQPWARLHAEGHGRPWLAAADFADRHHRRWADVLSG